MSDEDDLAARVEELAADEDKIPVVLMIHNGVVTEQGPQFVSLRYMLPVSVLMDVRGMFAPHEVL